MDSMEDREVILLTSHVVNLGQTWKQRKHQQAAISLLDGWEIKPDLESLQFYYG